MAWTSCSACGADVDGSAKFCHRCGVALKPTAVQPRTGKTYGYAVAVGMILAMCIVGYYAATSMYVNGGAAGAANATSTADTLAEWKKALLAHTTRGAALSKAGEYDAAILAFDSALAINANLSGVYLLRGIAYFSKGEFDSAFANYNAALRIDPNYPDALANRGTMHFIKGNYDSTIADCDAALRIKPNRGNAHYALGENDLAIADYDAALKIKPDRGETIRNRGNVYYEKGDYDRAIADYDAALGINPGDADLLKKREEARKKRGLR